MLAQINAVHGRLPAWPYLTQYNDIPQVCQLSSFYIDICLGLYIKSNVFLKFIFCPKYFVYFTSGVILRLRVTIDKLHVLQ